MKKFYELWDIYNSEGMDYIKGIPDILTNDLSMKLFKHFCDNYNKYDFYIELLFELDIPVESDLFIIRDGENIIDGMKKYYHIDKDRRLI